MLPEPVTAAGRAGLAGLLTAPERAVLAVDFDGTLAPIVERPEQARALPGAAAALAVLARRVGRCAVVTGRPAEVAVRLGGLDAAAGLVVLGHYGLQRWQDGRLTSPAPDPGVDQARRLLPAALAGAGAGVAVEDKHHSLVVHTRQAGDPAGELARLEPRLAALAAEHGLECVPGRFVLELRPPGVDKGGALLALAAEIEPAAVAFAGDDLGDLPAFAAIARLRGQGVAGLAIASGSAEVPQLAAAADLVLDGPVAVVAFLAELAERLGG